MLRILSRTGRRQGLLVFVGVLLALVILEVGLRLGGVLYSANQRRLESVRSPGDTALRVLCIGESTTALGGRNSYPLLLREKLETAFPGIAVGVRNGGLAGVSTDEILERLPGEIEKYAPHLVVAMMGVNDRLMMAESGESVFRDWLAPLQFLRVYKLYALLAEHLGHQFTSSGSNRSVPEAVEGETQPATLPARILLAAGERAGREGRNSQEILERELEDLRLAVLASSDNSELREELVLRLLYAAEDHEVLEQLGHLDKMRIPGTIRFVLGTFSARAAALEKAGKLHQARLRWEDVGRLARDSGSAVFARRAQAALAHTDTSQGRDPAGNPDSKAISSWSGRAQMDGGLPPETVENYLRLVTILAERGIPLVAVQYPTWPAAPLQAILPGDSGAVLVENRVNFTQAIERTGYWSLFSDRFAGDFGHFTPMGAALLAEQVSHGIAENFEPAQGPDGVRLVPKVGRD